VVDAVIQQRFSRAVEEGERVTTSGITYDVWGDTVHPENLGRWRSQVLALLAVVYGRNHTYFDDFAEATRTRENTAVISLDNAMRGLGIVRAAADDYANGYVWTLRERVHADLFDDFLEMAASLMTDGYVHAAAVIAGSTLEEHLRKLCEKNSIDVTVTRPNGTVEPKRASAMNEDLRRESIYSQPQWRFVQAWLDIRNDAAHGHYDNYEPEQVVQMIEGIRGFVVHYPA
jgi:hypothetical protein